MEKAQAEVHPEEGAFVRAYLSRAVLKDRLAHSYILYGPGKEERDKAAAQIAKGLACPNGPENNATPCGSCRVCREIANGAYAGFVQAGADKTNLEIEDIRKLGAELSISFEGRRIVFIPQLERLTQPAANAFLKILEEPGDLTVYIFTTQTVSSLLPTIVSRCHKLPLYIPPPEDRAGSLPQLDATLTDPQALSAMDLTNLLQPFPGKNKREKAGELLSYILAHAQLGLERLWGEPNETLFQALSPEKLVDLTEDLLLLSGDLRWNVNVDLLLENLAVKLKAACSA